jgi:hypothetical protein
MIPNISCCTTWISLQVRLYSFIEHDMTFRRAFCRPTNSSGLVVIAEGEYIRFRQTEIDPGVPLQNNEHLREALLVGIS